MSRVNSNPDGLQLPPGPAYVTFQLHHKLEHDLIYRHYQKAIINQQPRPDFLRGIN